MKNRNLLYTLLMGLTLLTLGACTSGKDLSTHQRAVVDEGCVVLYAGQHIDVGTVCVSNDDTTLTVTYNTTDGWLLNEVHLWVGTNLFDMPQNNSGNPQPGLFPYKLESLSTTTVSFEILLEDLRVKCGETLYLAAHAVVVKPDGEGGGGAETAWGDGKRVLDQGSWATYFEYTVKCETKKPPKDPTSCETAFAFGGEVSTALNSLLNTERWGWTNGPLESGHYVFELYAGAGQNSLDKGVLVGTVTVTYNGTQAVVTFNLIEGVTMEETHLYVGNELTPGTTSPGLYGNLHEFDEPVTSDTYIIDGLSGAIYVIAHTEVCIE
jgi:hypothetical protein